MISLKSDDQDHIKVKCVLNERTLKTVQEKSWTVNKWRYDVIDTFRVTADHRRFCAFNTFSLSYENSKYLNPTISLDTLWRSIAWCKPHYGAVFAFKFSFSPGRHVHIEEESLSACVSPHFEAVTPTMLLCRVIEGLSILSRSRYIWDCSNGSRIIFHKCSWKWGEKGT